VDVIIISGEVEAYVCAFTPLAIYVRKRAVSFTLLPLNPPGKESLYLSDR
jgi:hypothetical protein